MKYQQIEIHIFLHNVQIIWYLNGEKSIQLKLFLLNLHIQIQNHT